MVNQTQPGLVWTHAYFVYFRCYIIATCSVKISILLFYRRLSSNFNQVFFIATWIGIAYNIAYLVTFIFIIGFACRPAKAYWLQLDFAWATTHKFTCVDEHVSLPTSAATSVFGDFYATLLPCILILKLDLPRRQKMALYSLFLLGFLVVAAGIVRTIFINYLINETYDNTWYLWKFWLWTLIELYISIMAASAPALKPFFRRYLVDPIASRKGGSSTYARNGKAQSNGAQRKLWSNTSSTMPMNDNSDIEKIGMAVGGDGTRKYELRTLPSGKVEPVQVHVRPQQSIDLHSESQASGLYLNEHSEWNLPPTGPSDDSSLLRTYRAEIDALLPVPGPGRPAPVVGLASGHRSVTPSRQMRSGSLRSGSQHGHSTSIPRYSSQPNFQGGPERDRSQDLARRSSQGSVKAARLRAESIKGASAGAAARRAARQAAQDPDDSDIGYLPSDTSSSNETLHLPKQRNVFSGDYDDKSLHLPRQGIVDDEGFRWGKAGRAV